MLLCGLLALIGATLFWILALRRQVDSHTATIRQKLRQEARQREDAPSQPAASCTPRQSPPET